MTEELSGRRIEGHRQWAPRSGPNPAAEASEQSANPARDWIDDDQIVMGGKVNSRWLQAPATTFTEQDFLWHFADAPFPSSACGDGADVFSHTPATQLLTHTRHSNSPFDRPLTSENGVRSLLCQESLTSEPAQLK